MAFNRYRAGIGKKKMSLEMLVDALCCRLSGTVMQDPVIVVACDQCELEVGYSYERSALERWVQVHDEVSVRYMPNPSLKGTIRGLLHKQM